MCVCLYSKGSLFLDSISVVENFKFRTNTGSSINAYYSKPEMYQIPNLSTKDPVRAHKSTAEEKRSINISRNFPAFQHTRHNRTDISPLVHLITIPRIDVIGVPVSIERSAARLVLRTRKRTRV